MNGRPVRESEPDSRHAPSGPDTLGPNTCGPDTGRPDAWCTPNHQHSPEIPDRQHITAGRRNTHASHNPPARGGP